MALNHATFARLAGQVASIASRWGGEALDSEADLLKPVSDHALAVFIAEQCNALDRMWCYGVQGEPRPPKEGEIGSTVTSPRRSMLWPGDYFGECGQCGAYIMAAKRVTICDPCEEANRVALEARRKDLAERLKGSAPPPLAPPSSIGGQR